MASASTARKVVKTSQLPQAPAPSPSDLAHDCQDGQPATLYSFLMTAINFVAFLFSLVAVDIHYTLRRSAMGVPVPWLMPRWLHQLLRPQEPYENYYHTKQKKLLRMEAEEAFQLRNRTLVFLGVSVMGGMGLAWYFTDKIYQRWVR
ncbi:hypothetical protein NLU13_9024 [Sarocladium strictum]|uniref:Uncharacterized protein n=1 Tax=Sarocladium strictum TaxID=5046 RepID=A0AA39G9V2_SARSR|nr:hypothetical protein NLU13_9024 [Sarocladium strictum]